MLRRLTTAVSLVVVLVVQGESYKQHCARRYYAEGYKVLNSLRRRAATEGESIGKVSSGWWVVGSR